MIASSIHLGTLEEILSGKILVRDLSFSLIGLTCPKILLLFQASILCFILCSSCPEAQQMKRKILWYIAASFSYEKSFHESEDFIDWQELEIPVQRMLFYPYAHLHHSET
jgi:hypothetical protein